MLPGTDLKSLVPAAAAVGPISAAIAVADTRLQGANRLDQFAIGQQILAKVVSMFQDGSSLVKIGETAARMTLPANVRPGSSVLLTLTAKEPRPIFTMQAQAQTELDSDTLPLSAAGRQILSYNAAGSSALTQTELGIGGPGLRGTSPALTAAIANAATPAPLPGAQSPPESVSLTLSATGRIINNLLQAQPGGARAAIIGNPTALAGLPTMPTPQIASALHDSVAFSGVFYESHITEWANGKRNLSELQREPQAQIVKSLSNTDPLTRSDAIHTEIGKIVNMQLNALDQKRIYWQGEVWPGQHMEWEIARDHSDQSPRQDDNETAAWHSVVRFNFERLGTVAASIRLVGDQIHMQIRADNENATRALRQHGGELADSLATAGSPLDSLSVTQDGAA
jgi:flagellar hook-length control protein FliK